MTISRIFRILASIAVVLHGTVVHAAESRKDALSVSYKTPETGKGLGGRFELVRKLEARGFHLTIVSDRFPERANAIDPTPENLVAVLDLHGVPRKKHERSHSVLFGKTELSLDRFRPALRKLRAYRA